jgi:hypothetical protein
MNPSPVVDDRIRFTVILRRDGVRLAPVLSGVCGPWSRGLGAEDLIGVGVGEDAFRVDLVAHGQKVVEPGVHGA